MCRFGLIGCPIGHSLSPRLFAAAYGGRWPYELVETDDFNQAFDIFLKNCKAVNVTAPFKLKAAMRADWRSPEVERTGAANILLRRDDGSVAAFNSDYLGVRALLSERLAASVGKCPRSGPLPPAEPADPSLLRAEGGYAFPTELPASHYEDGAESREPRAERSAAIPLEGVQGVEQSGNSVAVIGFGGAGKAAYAAAQDLFQDVRLYRHDGIADGVEADIVIYTLPKAVPGTDRIRCRILMEANYKDPCLSGRNDFEYIPGTAWHLAQAVTGYELMTGAIPDRKAMSESYGK